SDRSRPRDLANIRLRSEDRVSPRNADWPFEPGCRQLASQEPARLGTASEVHGWPSPYDRMVRVYEKARSDCWQPRRDAHGTITRLFSAREQGCCQIVR